jgi:hypothetical protein
MKNMFLLIVVSVLLVTLGFGQTPAPYSNTDQASIKGCLGGSDGSYTLAEDGTTQTFKIATSTVDLKPHVGHDVEVIGQKANVAASSGSSDNSVVVTGVNMISEHCATATASASTATASTPAVADTTPTATASTSVVADTTPTATASTPAAADTTPTATASAPAAADTTPTATASTPAAADTTPTATASAPMMASASEPESTKHLPDTATPLPLLGLLGLGLLATGLMSRRARTN